MYYRLIFLLFVRGLFAPKRARSWETVFGFHVFEEPRLISREVSDDYCEPKRKKLISSDIYCNNKSSGIYCKNKSSRNDCKENNELIEELRFEVSQKHVYYSNHIFQASTILKEIRTWPLCTFAEIMARPDYSAEQKGKILREMDINRSDAVDYPESLRAISIVDELERLLKSIEEKKESRKTFIQNIIKDLQENVRKLCVEKNKIINKLFDYVKKEPGYFIKELEKRVEELIFDKHQLNIHKNTLQYTLESIKKITDMVSGEKDSDCDIENGELFDCKLNGIQNISKDLKEKIGKLILEKYGLNIQTNQLKYELNCIKKLTDIVSSDDKNSDCDDIRKTEVYDYNDESGALIEKLRDAVKQMCRYEDFFSTASVFIKEMRTWPLCTFAEMMARPDYSAEQERKISRVMGIINITGWLDRPERLRSASIVDELERVLKSIEESEKSLQTFMENTIKDLQDNVDKLREERNTLKGKLDYYFKKQPGCLTEELEKMVKELIFKKHQLNIHKNTLKYKLESIKKLTDMVSGDKDSDCDVENAEVFDYRLNEIKNVNKDLKEKVEKLILEKHGLNIQKNMLKSKLDSIKKLTSSIDTYRAASLCDIGICEVCNDKLNEIKKCKGLEEGVKELTFDIKRLNIQKNTLKCKLDNIKKLTDIVSGDKDSDCDIENREVLDHRLNEIKNVSKDLKEKVEKLILEKHGLNIQKNMLKSKLYGIKKLTNFIGTYRAASCYDTAICEAHNDKSNEIEKSTDVIRKDLEENFQELTFEEKLINIQENSLKYELDSIKKLTDFVSYGKDSGCNTGKFFYDSKLNDINEADKNLLKNELDGLEKLTSIVSKDLKENVRELTFEECVLNIEKNFLKYELDKMQK